MHVQINGEMREVSNQLTVSSLIEELKLPHDRLAIELNRAVIRRNDWPVTALGEGDKIEIVHFVGGGL